MHGSEPGDREERPILVTIAGLRVEEAGKAMPRCSIITTLVRRTTCQVRRSRQSRPSALSRSRRCRQRAHTHLRYVLARGPRTNATATPRRRLGGHRGRRGGSQAGRHGRRCRTRHGRSRSTWRRQRRMRVIAQSRGAAGARWCSEEQSGHGGDIYMVAHTYTAIGGYMAWPRGMSLFKVPRGRAGVDTVSLHTQEWITKPANLRRSVSGSRRERAARQDCC
ncbi:hypothetical protein B0H15DRAFT_357780 [Mycena belliarum]|uniref:Uncharacterized protein n=1 Tax=Mycena belliarum TaxID=1033014 RepID=A0AAD6U643_9AGAR|nr:hypothetical protein B0H15DRAFT_357780 [Mycena belliae]